MSTEILFFSFFFFSFSANALFSPSVYWWRIGLILQIKKFKDALAKHNPDRCSLGPTQGLEEKDLLALAANKELSFNYTPKPVEEAPIPTTVGGVRMSESERSRSDLEKLPLPLPSTILESAQVSKENAYVGWSWHPYPILNTSAFGRKGSGVLY